MMELKGQFAEPLESMTDQELSRRLAELPEIIRKVDSIAAKFPDMMTNCKDPADESKVDTFMEIYKEFLLVKDEYISNIRKTSDVKELDKEKKFKEASLNINLGKVSGYNSNKDFYTFKDEFEKLYLRITPTRMLPELLKNNHLDGPALTLVKHVDEVDEIWKRLKKTYGDPKVLLSNKLDELTKIELSKSKDPEKTMDSLHKIIATMNDLIKMSKKHGIANELFYGDGFERILRLLDDRRATKWITDTCDLELTKEQMWEDLIEYLQKEANALRSKIRLLGKPSNKDPPAQGPPKVNQKPKEGDGRNDTQVHHNDPTTKKDFNTSSICSFCGEDGHVQTTGPGGSKVVQYFSCEKFAAAGPDDRFQEIKRKGFCYQCLLPGALLNHKSGKCQTDFVCKDPSHNKFSNKKHVLVCEQHKESPQNLTILQEYKNKCILKDKMPNLPNFSKEIKLSFHAAFSMDSCDTVVSEDPGEPVEVDENLDPPVRDRATYQV